jgi:hypothetical protein
MELNMGEGAYALCQRSQPRLIQRRGSSWHHKGHVIAECKDVTRGSALMKSGNHHATAFQCWTK